MKERISNAADFPGLVVYRQAGPAGPVYSVEFSHKEQPGQFGAAVFSAGILVCLGAALWYGDPRWLGGSVASAVVMLLAWMPRRRSRSIELDFGREEFRVYRNGRVTLRKPLPRKALYLAVEPHKWIMSRDSGVRNTGAKMHCLVGYFGIAGTDRAELMCRHERSPIGGLREVVAAVMMAWEAGRRETMEPGNDESGPPLLPGGGAIPRLE
jgi:hypothetical protein